MRLAFILFFAGCIFSGCNEESKPLPPADLISKEQFIAILCDIRLLEGAYTTRYARIDTSALKIESYYLKLFQDHGLSAERFNQSYLWYATDQPKMLEIEEAVVTRITQMQSEVRPDTSNVQQVKPDSLMPKARSVQ
jgi:hypothetical protein